MDIDLFCSMKNYVKPSICFLSSDFWKIVYHVISRPDWIGVSGDCHGHGVYF